MCNLWRLREKREKGKRERERDPCFFKSFGVSFGSVLRRQKRDKTTSERINIII